MLTHVEDILQALLVGWRRFHGESAHPASAETRWDITQAASRVGVRCYCRASESGCTGLMTDLTRPVAH